MTEFSSEWRTAMNDGLTTDALWLSIRQKNGRFVIPERELFGDYNSNFHGLFIPEIPYQFIYRYAKTTGVIWDPFAGSGTTKYVAKKLGIEERVISNDINPIDSSIIQGDAETFDPEEFFVQKPILTFVHPPYYKIVKYSDKIEDLSNMNTLDEYYDKMYRVAQNIYKHSATDSHTILVCGNIWKDGEEIDLGVFVKEQFRKAGFKCKSHIIKDYGDPKSGTLSKNYHLRYYRNLRNDTNFFYGDNIFILKKTT